MSFITLRPLLLLGFAVVISSPAAAAESCATATGPVADGVQAVGACIAIGNVQCPIKGSIFVCRNGHWFCAHGMVGDPSAPCRSGEEGAWIWTANGGFQKAH
jgi:hypothetical protein